MFDSIDTTKKVDSVVLLAVAIAFFEFIIIPDASSPPT